jgi:hypothetical protein
MLISVQVFFGHGYIELVIRKPIPRGAGWNTGLPVRWNGLSAAPTPFL